MCVSRRGTALPTLTPQRNRTAKRFKKISCIFILFYLKPHWYLVISLPVQDRLSLVLPLDVSTSRYPDIYTKLSFSLKLRTIYGIKVK